MKQQSKFKHNENQRFSSVSSKMKQTEIGMIPEDWEEKSFGELCLVRRGASPRPIHDFISVSGIPWVKIADASAQNTRYIEWTNEFIIEKGRLNTVIVKPGDLIVSNSATPGIPKFMKINAAIHDGWLLLDPLEIVDKHFLYYLFLNERSKLVGIADGTVFKNLKTDIVRSHKVVIPKSLDEQRRIAKILWDIDSKIELNQQMNKTLEAIGQAIFKHWFIDFEFPNEKGKPYKSSGGEMVDSELGKIPKGWKVGKLREIGRIQPGFAFKSTDFINEGIKIIKIRNIQNGVVNLDSEDFVNDELFNITDKKFYLSSGDVIIAMTGAELGKVGIIPKIDEIMLLNQRVGKVVSNSRFLFYLYLTKNEIQDYMKGISSASSAQGNISNSDIENITIIVPDIHVLSRFSAVTNSLFDKLVDNLGENLILSQIRDSILPKLMSGKIRVPVETNR